MSRSASSCNRALDCSPRLSFARWTDTNRMPPFLPTFTLAALIRFNSADLGPTSTRAAPKCFMASTAAPAERAPFRVRRATPSIRRLPSLANWDSESRIRSGVDLSSCAITTCAVLRSVASTSFACGQLVTLELHTTNDLQRERAETRGARERTAICDAQHSR